jgi:hypothetical protein
VHESFRVQSNLSKALLTSGFWDMLLLATALSMAYQLRLSRINLILCDVRWRPFLDFSGAA